MIHRQSGKWALVPGYVVVLGLSVVICGCGGGDAGNPKGQTKPSVSAAGKVQIDGKPLEAGNITFISKDTGNSVGCVITNGTFSCKAEVGPNPGENAVIIAGKEKADGPALWTWNSNTKIASEGLKDGDFSIDSKATKKISAK